MPRFRAAAAAGAALVVAVACGPNPPTELDTAADPTAVVPLAESRPTRALLEPTTTTAPPPTTTTTSPPPPPTTTTSTPPEPARSAPAPSGGSGDPADPATWDRLAQCESGGDWSINTGNGYYGGIQFALSSWRSVGGEGYPHEHPREVQIEMGRRLWAQGGWHHWPACSRRFGWI